MQGYSSPDVLKKSCCGYIGKMWFFESICGKSAVLEFDLIFLEKLFFVTLWANHSKNTVEPLITVAFAQPPPPDLRSVKKVPAEFKVKIS